MLRFFVRTRKQFNYFQICAIHQTSSNFSEKDIIKRTTEIQKSSQKKTLKRFKDGLELAKNAFAPWTKNDDIVPWSDRPPQISPHCDFLIIGGGAIGSSIAYWLRKKLYNDTRVIVVEKDPTYTKASTVLSVGGLRQQFSLQENIEMSLFGAEFISNINEYLGIEGEPTIDPYYHPYGYLFLASEQGANILAKNSELQNRLGAKNILLTPQRLKDMFPWINTEDVALGCLGLEREGWFDAWTVLLALKKKALTLGAEYVYAEAKGFGHRYMEDENYNLAERLDSLIIETPEGEIKTIKFAVAIIAGGAFSGDIAKMAKVGTTIGIGSIALPVEPRKRYVYCFHCPNGPGLNTPLTIDYTGTYFRREGLAGTYICGRSPTESEEPPVEDLSVDYDYFEEKVWPVLAKRVKSFENLKLRPSWAGYYEYNTFDQNGIIGPHPFHNNLIFATGFSGHGIQQAPAVGRAISELVIDGKYMTIDLSKLGFDRIVFNRPMYENNIV